MDVHKVTVSDAARTVHWGETGKDQFMQIMKDAQTQSVKQ